MSIIRQGSLFDMQDFYELEPSKRPIGALRKIVKVKILFGSALRHI
jgi:hypothetical protein